MTTTNATKVASRDQNEDVDNNTEATLGFEIGKAALEGAMELEFEHPGSGQPR